MNCSDANDLGIIVLQAEMETCMRLLGAKNIEELGPRFVSLICHSYQRLFQTLFQSSLELT